MLILWKDNKNDKPLAELKTEKNEKLIQWGQSSGDKIPQSQVCGLPPTTWEAEKGESGGVPHQPQLHSKVETSLN